MIFSSLSGGIVVAIGILPWVGKFVQDRLILKWNQDYLKEIEYIKDSLNSNQEIIRATLSSYSTSHNYAQEKRLIAIEKLWECISLSTFYSVFLPNEYLIILEKEDYRYLLNKYSDDEIHKFPLVIDDIESQRPYLGEYMWGLFFAYRAFMLRMAVLFNHGVKKNNIPEWKYDVHLINLLKTSIGRGGFQKLDKNIPINILFAIGFFEQKILIEMNKNITGETASESNLHQAQRIIQLTSKIYKGDIVWIWYS